MHQRPWRPARRRRTRRPRAGPRPPSKLQPGLVAPAAQAAGARVVDAEQRGRRPGPSTTVAVEHPPARGRRGSCARTARGRGCRRRPSGRGPRRRSSESSENASQLLPVEVSSPASKHRARPAGVPDGAGDGVHADVVVAVGDQGHHRLVLRRLAQLEAGGPRGGVGIERLALVVGVHRAPHQPPGLRGGHVAAHLEPAAPRRAAAPRARGTRPATSTSWPIARRRRPRSTAATARARAGRPAPSASTPAPAGRAGAARAGAAGPAATRPGSAAARRRRRAARPQRQLAQRALDLGDLALGLAGDVGVAPRRAPAVDARRSCPARCRRRPGDRTARRTSGSTGPVSRRPARRACGSSTASWLATTTVAAAGQEQHGARDHRDHQPDREVRRARATRPRAPPSRRAGVGGGRRGRPGSGARPGDRVEGDRGGDAGVQRLQLVGHRDRQQLVAGLG